MELWVQARVKSTEEGRMTAEKDKAGSRTCGTPQRLSESIPYFCQGRSKSSLWNSPSFQSQGNFNIITEQGSGLPSPPWLLPGVTRSGHSVEDSGAE